MPKITVDTSDQFKEFLSVFAQANAMSISEVVRNALAAYMDYILLPDDVVDSKPTRARVARQKVSPEEALEARRAKKSKREAEIAKARADVAAKYKDGYPWQKEQAAS